MPAKTAEIVEAVVTEVQPVVVEAEPPVEEVKQEDVAAVAEPVTEPVTEPVAGSVETDSAGVLSTGKVRLKPERMSWLLLYPFPQPIRYPNWNGFWRKPV